MIMGHVIYFVEMVSWNLERIDRIYTNMYLLWHHLRYNHITRKVMPGENPQILMIVIMSSSFCKHCPKVSIEQKTGQQVV